MENFLHYAEEHPWLVGGLTLGAVFILLWLLGFFGSSSSSSSSSSGTNLAAAYYAAEAAQTTAGTQLQMATEYYTNQTAQDQIQANAATGIASTEANMYTTLGQQQAGVAINNSNDAASAATSEADFNYQTNLAADNAGIVNTYYSTIAPTELAMGGGDITANLAGANGSPIGFSTYVTGPLSPNDLLAEGYGPSSPVYQKLVATGAASTALS